MHIQHCIHNISGCGEIKRHQAVIIIKAILGHVTIPSVMLGDGRCQFRSWLSKRGVHFRREVFGEGDCQTIDIIFVCLPNKIGSVVMSYAPINLWPHSRELNVIYRSSAGYIYYTV